MRVKLAAGNWKDERAERRSCGGRRAHRHASRTAVRGADLPTRDPDRAHGGPRGGRTGWPWARRPVIRKQRARIPVICSAAMLADAGRAIRHRRTLRAPRRSLRVRRGHPCAGPRRAAGGPQGHRLRGRDRDPSADASNTLDIISGDSWRGPSPDLVTGESLVIAYEPVWAIGTGRTPTTDQIGEVHDFIRRTTRGALRRRRGAVGTPALWRLGQARKRGRDLRRFQTSTARLVGGASLKGVGFRRQSSRPLDAA